MTSFLYQAFIYLGSATLAVPIAKKLGLGSVLGYLLAGIVIGPVFSLVGSETQNLQHFAEFGVVMMLFLIGLELEPKVLWNMRHRLLGLGGLQLIITATAIFLLALAFGVAWKMALTIGLITSLSSTAIVLQTLSEKNLMRTEGGEASFSVLLFQDIAVIPILAIIPLLAVTSLLPGNDVNNPTSVIHATNITNVMESVLDNKDHASNIRNFKTEIEKPTLDSTGADSHDQDHSESTANEHASDHNISVSIVDGLPPFARTLFVLAAVGLIILFGHFLIQPFFKIIASTGLPELFTTACLLMVISISLLMLMVGLSPALGAFLAGVVLANSEFRHELESTIAPFKGLLLGLFFITVGAGIDFSVFVQQPIMILALTLGLISLKAIVLFLIAIFFKLESTNRWLFAIALAQTGEFGFVALSFSEQNGALSSHIGNVLALVIGLSMLLTPMLFIIYEKLIEPKLANNNYRQHDTIIETGDAILAGAGRFGQIVQRLLKHNNYNCTVIDNRISQVNLLRGFGVETFYGDPSKPELLLAAGIENARIFVISINDVNRSVEMVKYARRINPDVVILCRALHRAHYYALKAAGADEAIRDTFHSALLLSEIALTKMGLSDIIAKRQVELFKHKDEQHLDDLMDVWLENPDLQENSAFRAAATANHKLLHETLANDRKLSAEPDEN